MSGLFDQITNYSPPLLTAGQVNYKGTWSAAANSPTLVDPPAATSKGDYYVVSAAGTQFGITFAIGDWIISNGTAWEKVDLTDAVSSVFGRTGAVVGASTDYSSVGLTNTAIGASSPSTGAFTTVTASSTIAATGAVTGSNLSGTNTGDQTITLTGGVTGSGTGSFAATVVTNANLTGDVTSVGNATTLTNAPVIAKVLTGYVSGAGTVAATDSILQAIQKLNGNDATNANLTGAITSVGNATSLGSFSSANLSAALTDETGSGAAVFATSPTLVTPILGTPSSGTLSSCTGLPISTGVSGLGTGIATALAVNTGSAGAPVLFNGALGTPTSGTVTNLTGTASININGTVGATTASTGAFTTLSATGTITSNPASGENVNFQNGAGVSLGKVFNDAGFFNFQGSSNVSGTRIEHPTQVQNRINGATITTTNSTGLAVTGALSATGIVTAGDYFNATAADNGYRISGTTIIGGNGTNLFIKGATSVNFQVPNGSTVGTFSSTGLAVTGTLSTTGVTLVNGAAGTSYSYKGLHATGPQFFGYDNVVGNGYGGGVRGYSVAAQGGYVALGTVQNNSWTAGLTIDHLNNVGIGTASPSYRLDVNSTTDTKLLLTGSTNQNAMRFGAAGSANEYYVAAGNNLVTGGDKGFLIYNSTANQPQLFIEQSTRNIKVFAGFEVVGALSKGSGSFRIEHPLPEKSATHQLVHSFIEGPQADLIYRGKVVLIDGKALVNIDAAATMTEGTFEVLCRDVQCFTTNESGWTAVRGKVTGNILTIEAKNVDCTDEISWMVIGERQDPHMMETDWTDDNGKVIVEPLKPSIEPIQNT
jgi:hypothetical protein